MYGRTYLFLACLAVSGLALADSGQDLSSSLYKLDLMQAKNGSPEAQFSLGSRLEEGRGVPRDMGQALEWYRRAADGGYAPAQYKLGVLYETGKGVAADPKQADAWLQRAAKNGSQEARQHLDALAAAKTRRAQEARAARERAERERLAREKAAREKLAREKAERARKAHEAAARAAAERRREARLAAAAAAPKPSVPAAASAPARAQFPDLRAAVLAGKWYSAKRPAEYLPSSLTNCLSSGDHQVICFSRPNTRTVGSQTVTYTVKSVLTGFGSDGHFQVSYLFNVTDLGGSASAGPAKDPDGLQPKKGWQQPGRTLRCQARDATTLSCSGAGREQRFVAY